MPSPVGSLRQHQSSQIVQLWSDRLAVAAFTIDNTVISIIDPTIGSVKSSSPGQCHEYSWVWYSLVLAKVLGCADAVWVWNQIGWSCPGCYPENSGTLLVQGWVRTGLRFHLTVSTTLAAIKYLSFDCIMTRSICKLFSFSRSFTSCIEIVRLIFIEWVWINAWIQAKVVGCNCVVKYVWLGLPEGDVRCPVPGNRQPYIDIAKET
jgi:hypothetical protein